MLLPQFVREPTVRDRSAPRVATLAMVERYSPSRHTDFSLATTLYLRCQYFCANTAAVFSDKAPPSAG